MPQCLQPATRRCPSLQLQLPRQIVLRQASDSAKGGLSGCQRKEQAPPRRSPGLLRKARSVSNLPAPLPTQWCFLSLTVPLGAFLCVFDASAHACGLLIASSRVCAISVVPRALPSFFPRTQVRVIHNLYAGHRNFPLMASVFP